MSRLIPCIAFADLAGFTALTEAHGDDNAADVATEFYAMAERSLVGGTRVVKPIGDAVMLASDEPSMLLATIFGLACAADARALFPGIRAGLHAGEIVERGGDVFGTTVNVAARVAAHAQSGQILCTQTFVDWLDPRPAGVRPIGSVTFKNVLAPVSVVEIDLPSPMSLAETDPVCRMRVDLCAPAAERLHGGRVIRFCSDGCAATFDAAPHLFVRERV